MGDGWKNSNRRNELPSNWQQLRIQVLIRDGYQCTFIDEASTRRCEKHATDVDHIVHGNDHTLRNLRALCQWHHKKKTSMEGNQSPMRRSTSNSRPKPAHPGIL